MLVALAMVTTACSGSGQRATATPRTAFAPTIEAAPPVVEQMLQRVAAIRGLAPPASLKVGLVARSQVPALLDSLTTEADQRIMSQTTTLYRLLGHLQPDQDYQTIYDGFVAQALVGLYSPKDKALWVVHPDGQATDFSHLSTSETQALAHELVHAVQDANFDLGRIEAADASNLDLGIAATCVIEGDAVSTQRNYSAKYAAMPFGNAVLLANVDKFSAAIPASIQRELLFPYTEGADWIDGIRQQGGNEAVNALLRNPPAGTVYVFHPGLLGSGWVPDRVGLPDLAGALGTRWRQDSGGQFGQFELQNYLQLRLPGLQAVQGADGWQGDHYDVYRSGSGSVAAFRVVFADAADATRFAAAQDALLKAENARASSDNGLSVASLPTGNTTIRLPVQGATVTFVIGSNAKVAKRAAVALAHG